MRKLIFVLMALATGAGAACTGNDKPADPCVPYGSPLDKALCERFQEVDYEPIVASEHEFCTRLWVDLLGKRPTESDLQAQCYGRDPLDIVRGLQAREEYRVMQRRRWADVLKYNEYTADILYIKDLDELVDAMYKSQIDYGDFGEAALTHPAFVGRHIGYGQPQLVAGAAFEAFLGRKATQPEMVDVGNLWRAFYPEPFLEDGPTGDAEAAVGVGEEVPNPSGLYYAPPLYIDPRACAAGVSSCRSELLGPAEVAFPANGRSNLIEVWQLTPEEWDVLQVTGRTFVNQPMYWEAQVDLVLQRYLGYDLGSLVPEARQELARWFQNRRDVPALERMVLLSWAYRQTALEVEDNPRPTALLNQPYAYGPTKLMLPEVWLNSVSDVTGQSAGNCDWRYPNLHEWYYPDANLDALTEDVYPRDANGYIDPWYKRAAASMGGCPNDFDYYTYTARDRSHHMGLMVAVAQEEATVELCLVRGTPGLIPEGVDPTDTSAAAAEAVVRHVLSLTTGKKAVDSEVQTVLDAAATGCASCDAENLARELCAGLVGSTRYVFY